MEYEYIRVPISLFTNQIPFFFFTLSFIDNKKSKLHIEYVIRKRNRYQLRPLYLHVLLDQKQLFQHRAL